MQPVFYYLYHFSIKSVIYCNPAGKKFFYLELLPVYFKYIIDISEDVYAKIQTSGGVLWLKDF